MTVHQMEREPCSVCIHPAQQRLHLLLHACISCRAVVQATVLCYCRIWSSCAHQRVSLVYPVYPRVPSWLMITDLFLC